MAHFTSAQLSPQQIHLWQSSFLALNQARLAVARSLMAARQQIVLDVLPLLLHLNHPRLPGFINNQVPCGIAHYNPDQQALQSLQSIARGLQLPRGFRLQQIRGVYLMGSLGSLAQVRSSDLDVWLCYDESLPPEDIAALQSKCDLIERWAGHQGVELHVFLMNLSAFRQGQSQAAEGEDCGSSQHRLLLDEFYRSALWLAGCQPRWWLIPAEHESQADGFWQRLLEQHRIHPDHWLDFGAIPDIPAAEFVGAGLWQLNKGLSAPYKSLLKLLLTRHYAGQYPAMRPLCWDLKAQVHAGITDVGSNDAYLLLLARITAQLQQEGNRERVELARRAFYFKVKLPLSRMNPAQRRNWRAETLLTLCRDWGWSEATFADLDQRPQWSPLRVAHERNALISEMLGSYRFLAAFSQKHVTRLHINRQDMQTLGNRLHAAFDARPGKIININPGISPSLAQEKLTLNRRHPLWQLIPGIFHPRHDETPEQTLVLRQSPGLVELLCFARLNGLLDNHTQILISPADGEPGPYELKEVVGVIKNLTPQQPAAKNFLSPARPLQWHLLVNVGVDPQRELSRRGMQKISNRDDALGYSSARENLVQTLDLIVVNSWGEWVVERFTGTEAMLHCLGYLLQQLPLARKQGWPALQVHCHCASRASAIRLRVEQLINDVLQHFIALPKSPYLIEVAAHWYLLEDSKEGVQLHSAGSPGNLLALLARPARTFTAYTLDRTALLNSPLRLILSEAKPGQWHLYYWRYGQKVYVYLVDEKGALIHLQWPDNERGSQFWLMPLLRFLHQVDQRWQLQDGRLQARKIALTEIRRKQHSVAFESIRRRLPDLSQQVSSIDLRAVMNSEQQATIYCDGIEFSSWQNGDDLYRAVVREVIQRRGSKGDYPLSLSDVELPENQNILDHLQARQRLEQRLAQALREVRETQT